MSYRLGDQQVRHNHLHHLPPVGSLVPTEKALARLLGDLQESEAAQQDLLREAALPAKERAVLFELENFLASRAARRPHMLNWCDFEPGPTGCLSVTVTDLSYEEQVKVGDCVYGGFSLQRTESGPLRVLPRMFRKVCDNGQVMAVQGLERIMRQKGDLASAWEYCMSPEFARQAASNFRRSTLIPIIDPSPLFSPISRPPVRLLAQAEWLRAGDQSLWGAANALTAAARRIESPGLRLHYEAKAGAFLLKLVRAARIGCSQPDLL